MPRIPQRIFFDHLWACEVSLATAITKLKRGTLTVTVKDKQGNVTRIERTITVGAVK